MIPMMAIVIRATGDRIAVNGWSKANMMSVLKHGAMMNTGKSGIIMVLNSVLQYTIRGKNNV